MRKQEYMKMNNDRNENENENETYPILCGEPVRDDGTCPWEERLWLDECNQGRVPHIIGRFGHHQGLHE
jgi:hypothetical protein